MLVTTLGGRAAEELIFDTVTTGAANDIEKATELARNMITRFGMSEKFGLMGLARVQDAYLTGRSTLECGDETATEIDHEVMKMLSAAYDEAKRILSENIDILHKISAYLIEKETITGKEFMRILHEVRGDGDDSEEVHAESDDKTDTAAASKEAVTGEDISPDREHDPASEYAKAVREAGIATHETAAACGSNAENGGTAEPQDPEEAPADGNVSNTEEDSNV